MANSPYAAPAGAVIVMDARAHEVETDTSAPAALVMNVPAASYQYTHTCPVVLDPPERRTRTPAVHEAPGLT